MTNRPSDKTDNEPFFYELNSYDIQRKPQTLVYDNSIVRVPLDPVLKSLRCPICLDFLTNTMATIQCIHRFCNDCISRWLQSDNKQCPSCRKQLKSKRYLRADHLTDSIVDMVKKQQIKLKELENQYQNQMDNNTGSDEN
ncbi:unnamed protein product [Didymodactylos carnosus]|uniref:RING-type E3 ubiquitin transferase n=1 Tax=Didymodactylos carnosus TaxID=1234261 RepID=A0A814QN64_9BILA|nr:unnamed protein product [Didymodactylos carnosus]CAF3884244.1 unnamed protein product [Didymodactylos carnosus]